MEEAILPPPQIQKESGHPVSQPLSSAAEQTIGPRWGLVESGVLVERDRQAAKSGAPFLRTAGRGGREEGDQNTGDCWGIGLGYVREIAPERPRRGNKVNAE